MSSYPSSYKLFTALLVLLALSFTSPLHVNGAVLINEIMADNGSTFADPQGEYDDWIEIYNAGPGTVDLGGMYLTDDLLNPNQWQFPAGTFVGPDDYVVVWADEDVIAASGLHANFKLNAGGEQIGLYSTNGATLLDSVSFGNQSQDVSYGRFPNGSGSWYFMDAPSPNAANTTAQSEPVYFSRLGGVMTNSFTLKLSTPSDSGSIRYTTDGSIPTGSSILYSDATGISINNSDSRRIRARAFQSGLAPGPVRTEAYLAVSSALETFDSNLPIVIIDTFGQTMPASWWENNEFGGYIVHPDPIAAYTAIIDTNAVTGRAATVDQPDYAGRAGINTRGQSSVELPKKPYKLETWGEDDADKRVPMLGLPANSDWVLHNPYTDKTFMRSAFAYHLSNDMGHYSSRTRFIEVFKNEDGGQIGGPASSDYLGVYVLMEKIKRGKDQVDIEELRPTDSAEPEISGGYIIRHDKNRGEDSFWTPYSGRWWYVDPSDIELTTAQKNYIENYITTFEAVHQSAGFDDPNTGYAQYIDVESFIDNDFCSEITREADTYNFSTYVTKDRGGKLKMSPQWDFNLSMGNNEYSVFGANIHVTDGWHRTRGSVNGWEPSWGYQWHERLLDDPEYLLKYADRWFHLRETVISDAAIEQTLDVNRALIDAEAAGRNFSRWDILNTKVGFSWSGDGPTFYYGGNPKLPCYGSDHTYAMQVEWMKNWLTGNGTPSGSCAAEAYAPQYSDRLGWIDQNMADRAGLGTAQAGFSMNSVSVNAGAVVSLPTNLFITVITPEPFWSGNVYYTLDGTDPRQPFTGNAVGNAYSSGIALNKTADVRARVFDGTGWSPMNRAVFADDRPLTDLRITEVMYHPENPGEEYIELKNIGPESISLYLCEFTDGIRFTFPDMMLAPGQHVLLVETQAVFEARYGTGHLIAGEFNIGSALNNGGEEIVLRDAAGREIHDFDYNDWYPATDGRGGSLGIIDPANADLTLWDQKIGWQASSAAGGSPGADNPTNAVANGAIVINEILAHTDEAGGDWIELYNTEKSLTIDIGGWFLSDDIDDLKKYQIASGTSIAGGGTVLFTQEANFGTNSTDPGRLTGFGLSELGESVYLSSGSGTNLGGGYSISEDFEASAKEVTLGRYRKSKASGSGVDFVPMASATPGAANSGPLIPDVVINQIMYNPSLHPDEVAEYIELFNHSSRTVPLYDPAYPSNTWKFTKGIDYTFPPGVSIPAGGHVLVVRTDPDVFRHVHGIPASRPIYGPYSDALGNDGEKIELSMPGDPEPGFVPYIRTEKVNFSDGSHPLGNDPWPSEADGLLGYSLNRVVAGGYGNDVANWQAAAPSPATPDLNFIELQQSGGSTFLLWAPDKVLQSAPELNGPWTNVAGATSPYELIPSQPAQYFRVQ